MGFELPDKVFYFAIKAHSKYRALPPDEFYLWEDANPERFFRWMWYFKYRAALLTVKYPRGTIIVDQGSRQPKCEEEVNFIAITKLRNRVRAKKGKITEYRNKIKQFEEGWKERYPIAGLVPIDNDEGYNNAREKVFRLQGELLSMEHELKILEDE